jgi:hypothetical protein
LGRLLSLVDGYSFALWPLPFQKNIRRNQQTEEEEEEPFFSFSLIFIFLFKEEETVARRAWHL